MASEKARRESTTNEGDIRLQKERVPKVTIQFESLADKPKDEIRETQFEFGGSDEKDRVGGGRGETYRAGKFEMTGEDGKEYESKEGSEETKERYDKAEEEGREGDNREQERPTLEEISKLRGMAQQSSVEAINAAQERYEKAKEKANQGLGSATEYAKEKTSQAKESLSEGAQKASQYVTEKGREVKDRAVEKGQQGLEAVKDTAAKAKDSTVESGKGAASYVGRVAADVKDKTAVASWTAAHYTAEKTVEGTKAAARVVQENKEYVTHKATELVSKPLGAVKESVAGTGESLKEYTARKKEEAETQIQARKEAEKQGGDYNEESQVYATGGEYEEEQQSFGETTSKQDFYTTQEDGGGSGGSILEAIGETLVEIAQKTKEMVLGHGKTGSLGSWTEFSKHREQQEEEGQ